MNDSTIVKLVAIVCLTVICSVALLKGIDSTLTGSICAIIGGVAGYEFGRRQKTTDESKEG
jgi:curli biogenesis system outer membrane secretion channel CsgG